MLSFVKKFMCFFLLFSNAPTICAEATAPKQLLISIKPLYAIVAPLVKNTHIQASVLLNENDSLHQAHLKPSYLQKVHIADKVIYMHPKFEVFMASLLKTENTEKFYAIQTLKDLTIYPTRTHMLWHQEKNSDHHDHTYKHFKTDMHLWLDISNAQKIVQEILPILQKLSPQDSDILAHNLKKWHARLTALDAEISEKLSTVKNKPYLVWHDAYQYFEKRYDLNSLGTLYLNPNDGLKPQHLQALQAKIQKQKVTCLFTEPYFNQKTLDFLKENTSLKTETLVPEAILLPTTDRLYENILRTMTKKIQTCLQ